MAALAGVIGRGEDVERYTTLFNDIKRAFIEAYVSPDGRVKGETQTCYIMALRMGLLPEELRAAAARYLVEDIEARDWHLSTGFLGTPFLLPVLAEAGYADVAYRVLNSDTLPSWGHMLKQGATTIWERWDGWTEHAGFQSPTMNSFNHYSLGSVGDWLFGRVAGIDQTAGSVAYSELLLRPLPGGQLTWARAEQETARGRATCGWHLNDGRITVSVTVPPGCTAVLEIPTADGIGVLENDAPVAGQPGILAVQPSAKGVTLRLASGRYTFSALAPGAEHINS
jgi:alpha-L-rhamnosidase